MKILAPVNSVHEAKILMDYGADELYCGLNPELYRNINQQGLWLNRRGPGKANLDSAEELKELVDKAHRRGVKVFLTLNQPGYDPEFYTDILSIVRYVHEYCRIDAFIIADPGLIRLLKETLPDLVIHVSSLATVLNSASVSFFSKMEVRRIIFPRYVELDTMKSIIKRNSDHLEYEAFILNDGCVFEEGYCNVSHAFGGAICHNPAWVYKPIRTKEDGSIDERQPRAGQLLAVKESLQDHFDEYKRWLWIGIKNFGERTGPKGYPLGMCGLCALYQLKEMGVMSLKIVGREAPLNKKIGSVKLVKKMLDYLEEGHSQEEIIKQAISIKGLKHLCNSGYMCYYKFSSQ